MPIFQAHLLSPSLQNVHSCSILNHLRSLLHICLSLSLSSLSLPIKFTISASLSFTSTSHDGRPSQPSGYRQFFFLYHLSLKLYEIFQRITFRIILESSLNSPQPCAFGLINKPHQVWLTWKSILPGRDFQLFRLCIHILLTFNSTR